MDEVSRKLRAQAGAAAMLAKYGNEAPAARARKGKMAQYMSQVDPEGRLPELERLRRAEALQRSKMLELTRRSREVRAARKRAKSALQRRNVVHTESLRTYLGGYSQAS